MKDHEHCVQIGRCWQTREPCPALDAFYQVSRGEILIEVRSDRDNALLTLRETPCGIHARIEGVPPRTINLSPYQALQLEEFLQRARHIRDHIASQAAEALNEFQAGGGQSLDEALADAEQHLKDNPKWPAG